MKNIGKVDKLIRIIFAVVLFSLLFILKGNIRLIGLLGIIPLLTAFWGVCPLYNLFGINTNTKK